MPAQRAATSTWPFRVAPERLPVALQSLRHRNYRLLWIGTIISNSGDWMDQIALNWLVYQLSGSAVQLALLNLCRLAPIFVVTLVGGDHAINRRDDLRALPAGRGFCRKCCGARLDRKPRVGELD